MVVQSLFLFVYCCVSFCSSLNCRVWFVFIAIPTCKVASFASASGSVQSFFHLKLYDMIESI